MRNLTRFTLLGIAGALVIGAASCDEYLGNVNEGLNIHDLGGKVLIPKAQVANTTALGVVYIGIYSDVNTQYGFLGPVTAPAPAGQIGDAFPYGGTSVGDYYTRDARYVCQTISNRQVKDAGTNWEVDFSILQFPFYKGSRVWAFADQNSSTCNGSGGYYDAVSIYINPTSVTAGSNGNYSLQIDPTDLSSFLGSGVGSAPLENLVDAQQRLYRVTSLDDVNNVVHVKDFYNYNRAPAIQGFWPPQLQQPNNNMYYGTQYNDVLNRPAGPYVDSGDLIQSSPPTLNDLSAVTLTLDTVVP